MLELDLLNYQTYPSWKSFNSKKMEILSEQFSLFGCINN